MISLPSHSLGRHCGCLEDLVAVPNPFPSTICNWVLCKPRIQVNLSKEKSPDVPSISVEPCASSVVPLDNVFGGYGPTPIDSKFKQEPLRDLRDIVPGFQCLKRMIGSPRCIGNREDGRFVHVVRPLIPRPPVSVFCEKLKQTSSSHLSDSGNVEGSWAQVNFQ